MEPFCSNEKCMFHSIDVRPQDQMLELETDTDTPIVLAEAHSKGFISRASLMQDGKVAAKFCDTCMSAINHVHEIDRRVI